MDKKKPKKTVKPPPGPPTWTETPQVPPDLLARVEKEIAQAKKKKEKRQ